MSIVRWLSIIAINLTLVIAVCISAQAYQDTAVTLSFTPKKDQKSRYLYVMGGSGGITSPGEETRRIFPDGFSIYAIVEDSVLDSTLGLSRHNWHFHMYLTNSRPAQRRNDGPELPQDEGGGGGGGRRGLGGGGGGGLGYEMPAFRSLQPGQSIFDSKLNLSDYLSNSNRIMQQTPGGDVGPGGGMGGGGGAGGGRTGTREEENIIGINKITVSDIQFDKDQFGNILNVKGLEMMKEYSKRNILDSPINIDVSFLFDWAQMLVVPDYPVFDGDVWFASVPMQVPGLPESQDIRLSYRVETLHNFFDRRLALIDAIGEMPFDQEWEEENDTEHVKFKAFGRQIYNGRFLFDHSRNMLFGIERPPIIDFRNLRPIPGCVTTGIDPLAEALGCTRAFIANRRAGIGLASLGMTFPGIYVDTKMRYYTRTTSKRKTIVRQTEKDMIKRRYVQLTTYAQMEAEQLKPSFLIRLSLDSLHVVGKC